MFKHLETVPANGEWGCPVFHYGFTAFNRADRGPRHDAGEAVIVKLGDPLTYGATTRGLLICDDWDKAMFRFPAALHDVACNLRYTGRRTYSMGDGSTWKKGRLTWVGDCEPDVEIPCWIRVL